MANKIEYSRILLKRSGQAGVIPTIPTGTTIDNTWLPTDLLVGEGFINVVDNRLWYRTNNGLIEYGAQTEQTTGTTISFTTNKVYNTPTSPETGNITDDLTNAKIGVVQKIYHNHSTAPTFPTGWVRLGDGTYTVSVLNIIYAEWVSGTRVEYWIIQES